MATLQLDIAYDDTLEDTLGSIPSDIAVAFRVVNANGPGGGWPVIEFVGERAMIERLVREWYSSEDSREADYLLTGK